MLWEWSLVREVGYSYEMTFSPRSCLKECLHSKKLVSKAEKTSSIHLVFGRQCSVKKKRMSQDKYLGHRRLLLFSMVLSVIREQDPQMSPRWADNQHNKKRKKASNQAPFRRWSGLLLTSSRGRGGWSMVHRRLAFSIL